MSSLFYIVAIVLVIVSPLIVPVAVSIREAVSGWQRRAAAARPARSPAIAGAVPAAA